MDYKRVRRRVLWQEESYRMVRYLIVYGGGDGTWEMPYYTKPTMYWEVQEYCESTWLGIDWHSLHVLTRDGLDDEYLHANRDRRRQITIENAQRGRDWLAKHQRLLAAESWELRCDSIDGEGTPCPIQRNGRCDITRWSGHGYASNGKGRPLPGICDAPCLQGHFPSQRDEHGNTYKYYRDLLREAA